MVVAGGLTAITGVEGRQWEKWRGRAGEGDEHCACAGLAVSDSLHTGTGKLEQPSCR